MTKDNDTKNLCQSKFNNLKDPNKKQELELGDKSFTESIVNYISQNNTQLRYARINLKDIYRIDQDGNKVPIDERLTVGGYLF